MRQLGSKLLAGGLSAGVVLLWWPLFFPTDSVTTWLGRGIVWTLFFELLLVALSPFELALWSTHRGERISRRVEAKRALLDHESSRRRIGRRAALAVAALALPLALICLGVSSHIPAGHAATPPRVTRLTRIVRVVKPVRVERVVKIRTVSQEVPVYTAPAASASAPLHKSVSAPKGVAKQPATPRSQKSPTARTNTPAKNPGAPTTTTGAPTPAPAPQTSAPAADQSGAAASPST